MKNCKPKENKSNQTTKKCTKSSGNKKKCVFREWNNQQRMDVLVHSKQIFFLFFFSIQRHRKRLSKQIWKNNLLFYSCVRNEPPKSFVYTYIYLCVVLGTCLIFNGTSNNVYRANNNNNGDNNTTEQHKEMKSEI